MFINRRKIQKNLSHNNAGFTLVEMVITIVIIAILAGVTAFGILSWQDWSRFNQQNEYAQTLFVSAQNQLAEFAADGRLEEMQESLKESSDEENTSYCNSQEYGFNLTEVIGNIIGPDGKPYDLSKIFVESSGEDSSNVKKYQREIVSLRAEAGEYREYLENPDAYKVSNPQGYWVFELLGAYVYDTTILDGGDNGEAAICIELTPDDGQVFAVLYSNRTQAFKYDAADINDNIVTSKASCSNIANRTEKVRREDMIGYYGVDTLYAATKNQVITPVISSVKLFNKETFYLKTKLKKDQSRLLTQSLNYEIDLDYEKNNTAKKLTVMLDGRKLKGKNEVDPNKNAIECPVYRYDGGERIELGTFPILAWVEAEDSNPVICVVYDAADIQANTYLYDKEFYTIKSNSPKKAEEAAFSKTYSFFRFGVDIDDVYATVVAKGNGYKDSKPASNFNNANISKNQNGKNPCFASIKKTGDSSVEYKYSIVNARHLYNIRYIEDLEYAKEVDGYKKVTEITGVTFRLEENIDFALFQAEGNLYRSNAVKDDGKVKLEELSGKIYPLNVVADKVIGLKRDGAVLNPDYSYQVINTVNCDFPSFKQLRENDILDGNNKELKGIRTSEISNVYYYIYSAEEEKKIGLFNVNLGIIKNLAIDDFYIKGSNKVGAICGVNKGELANLETKNTNRISQVSGIKNTGGIMGLQDMAGEADTIIKITGLKNSAGVYGTEAVGGIVGMIRKSEDASGKMAKAVEIEKCENHGPVYGFEQSDLKGIFVQGDDAAKALPENEKIRYIGGIVGYCYNSSDNADNVKLKECTSVLQYTGAELDAILMSTSSLNAKLKGDYVGGIAGYNYNGTIEDCSTGTMSKEIGCVFGYRYVGGIVGLNNGPLIYSDGATAGRGINGNHVIGCSYVGGITGANADVYSDKAYAFEDGKIVIKSDLADANLSDPEKIGDYILLTNAQRSTEAQVRNWINTGVVIATEEYAGGITGFNTGWINQCYSDVELAAVDKYFGKMTSLHELGDYCGGIAGYNNGDIDNVNDKNERVSQGIISAEVYVNGHNYVGGIVGYNDINAVVEDYKVTGGYVKGDLGSAFIGGYVGFNASSDLLMKKTNQQMLTEAEARKLARNIESNPGKVEGSYFIGGSIGANVINANSYGVTISDAGIVGGETDLGGVVADMSCDYKWAAIGVVDVRITITNNTEIDIKDWSVPIEHYNRVEPTLTGNGSRNMRLNSANDAFVPINEADKVIRSGQTFVGRIRIKAKDWAGLENELHNFEALYDGKTLPLKGTFISRPRGDKYFYAQFKTDNFLGTLDGEEFVGGFIGYNLLFDIDEMGATWIKGDEDAYRGAEYIVQREIVKAFENVDGDDATGDNEKLAARKEILDKLDNDLLQITDSKTESDPVVQMYISGKASDDRTSSSFGRVSAQIYVGGVLGYNDESTNLYIEHIENATPVVAKTAIIFEQEQNYRKPSDLEDKIRKTDYDEKAFEYTYSYAGGIIGKVSKNATIDDCINLQSGVVDTKGTYTGGICEINEGRIINCEVSNFGSGSDDYIGGLCGLNKGTIESCTFANAIVSGRNVVGGIAAENFGTIKLIRLENPRIKATVDNGRRGDGVAGVITGFNGELGEIKLNDNLEMISVVSVGRYVGGVTGINEGAVKNDFVNDHINDNLIITGNIEGSYDVGALIGLNRDKNISHVICNYTNRATVLSSNGNAGGIVGINDSGNSIRFCVNDGVVSATTGNAGGITCENNGIINHCYGYKTVSAPKGMCGGIVSINGAEKSGELSNAMVTACYVGTYSDSSGEKISFVSSKVVGGIAAQNYGVLDENVLANVTITNTTASTGTKMGVVAGENKKGGRIYLSGIGVSVNDNCTVMVQSDRCNAGGVAGTNDGIITNRKSFIADTVVTEENGNGYAVIGAKIDLGTANYGNIGGIAGCNTGTVAFCQVDTAIAGNISIDKTGYGGIAGINGYEEKGKFDDIVATNSDGIADKGDAVIEHYMAKIVNCSFDGDIKAIGSAGSPANIGGIAGINGYGGYIAKCDLGVRDTDINGNAKAINQTRIYSSQITLATDDNGLGSINTVFPVTSPDNIAYAYLGGIAGRNYSDIRDIDMRASHPYDAADASNAHPYDNVGTYQKKARGDRIYIFGFAGDIGGMVGFQYEDGTLTGYADSEGEHYITTPTNMTVEMRSGENDHGCGGVIGYSQSLSNKLEYIKNYAYVINRVQINVKTGGIIGTWDQSRSTGVDFYRLDNFGKVEGLYQIGGLIGRTKYFGFNMNDCNNYGEIYVNASDYPSVSGNGLMGGGLVGAVYEAHDNEIRFVDCDNHGYVHLSSTGSYSNADNETGCLGGFLGKNFSKDNVSLYFYKCCNIGVVRYDDYALSQSPFGNNIAKSPIGDFVGDGDVKYKSTSPIYIERCQSYNTNLAVNSATGNKNDRYFKDTVIYRNAYVSARSEASDNSTNSKTGNELAYVGAPFYGGKYFEERRKASAPPSDQHKGEVYNCYIDDNIGTTGLRYNSTAEEKINNIWNKTKLETNLLRTTVTGNYSLQSLYRYSRSHNNSDLRAVSFNVSYANNPLYNYDNETQKDAVTSANATAIAGNLGYSQFDVNLDGKVDSNAAIRGKREGIHNETCDKYIGMLEDYYTYYTSDSYKLSKPSVEVNFIGGRYKVTWDNELKSDDSPIGDYLFNKEAYEYEIKIVYENAAGETEEKIFTQGTLNRKLYITPDEKWQDNGIKIFVRAVNGYRYTNGSEIHDSEWSDEKVVRGTPLPKPIVHVEATGDNKFVAVLENRDEYMSDGEYIEANVEAQLYINTQTSEKYTFNIPVAEDNISEEAYFIQMEKEGEADQVTWSVSSDTTMVAQALYIGGDDKFFDSDTYSKVGRMVDSSALSAKSSYVDASFQGFFGTDADNMTYNIFFDVIANRDSTLRTDMLAYDENIGAYVAFAYADDIHVASSGGTTTKTSTISGIPSEWFAENMQNEIIVREYLKLGQQSIAQYEHLVASMVELNGEDSEENITILKNILDPYHITTEGNVVSINANTSIWDSDSNCLKPGYTLFRRLGEDDEYVYDIYYNATLEGAQKAAKGSDLLYDKYCVDYRVYTSDKLQITLDNDTASQEEMSYISVNDNDYQETLGVSGTGIGNVSSLPNPITNTNVVEVQPAPVIDKNVIETIGGGVKSYEFTFDRYIVRKNTILPDVNAAATWEAFTKKAKVMSDAVAIEYENTYKDAEYKVAFIGITDDGEEAIIETKVVDASETFAENDQYTLYGHKVTFSDNNNVWGNYSDFMIRVMRQGAKTSNNGALTGEYDNTFVLPRYSEHKIHIIKKFDAIAQPVVNAPLPDSVDDLTYKVKFQAINDDKQVADLGGYLVTVASSSGTKEEYFYVEYGDIQYYLDSELAGKSITKIDISGNLYSENGSQYSISVDLSDFEADETVNISVKAIANADAINYMTGDDGNTTPATVYAHLVVPTVDKVVVTSSGMGETVDESNPESVDGETYEKGLYIRYETDYSADNYDDNTEIQYAIALYDEALGDDSSKIAVGDGENEIGRWNYNSIKTISSKTTPNIKARVNEEIVIDISSLETYRGEFAGKWIKLAIRSVATGKFGSPWSDNDVAGYTINYRWIHIPELIIDAGSSSDPLSGSSSDPLSGSSSDPLSGSSSDPLSGSSSDPLNESSNSDPLNESSTDTIDNSSADETENVEE